MQGEEIWGSRIGELPPLPSSGTVGEGEWAIAGAKEALGHGDELAQGL